MDRYRLGIVIPAYNEAGRLPATLAAIAATRLPKVRLERLVIALNGPTTDGTGPSALAIGTELGLPIEVWDLPSRGKATALATAMPRLAEAHPELDGILFMDADNATPLAALAAFDLAADPGALWIASRKAPGARIIRPGGDSIVRRAMSLGMSRLARILLGLPERDTQCGFKVFPTAVVGPLFGALRSRDWVFDAELLARAHRAGLVVHEVPVTWTEMAGSKVRPVRDSLASVLGLVRIARWLGRPQRSATASRRNPSNAL